MHRTVVLLLCVCVASTDGYESTEQLEKKPNFPPAVSLDSPAHAGSSQCQVNGVALNDRATWMAQPCSECKCHLGVIVCQPIPCTNTVHRIKKVIHKTEKKKEKRDIKNANKNNRRALEVKYKTMGTAPNSGKEVMLKSVVKQKTVGGGQPAARRMLNVRGAKPHEMMKAPETLGKLRDMITKMKKLKIAKKHLMNEDDDDNEEDDDEDMDSLPAFRGPFYHTSHYTRKNGFMKFFPAGCLLSESVIACGNAGMTELPVITDRRIRTLYLPENKIRKIPPQGLAGLTNLEWLDLSKNKLVDSSLSSNLFRSLKKLKRLNLDGNSLTKIPLLPPSLEELKINDNKISILTSYSFQGLFNLLTLELEDNRLHNGNVSPLTFRPLRKLTYLRLEENKFCAIPSGLPSSLQVLQLSENRIDGVQEGILNKTVHLKALDLSQNQISVARIAPRAWTYLLELETLDLSHNKLVHVPSYLPKTLRHLSLHHNQIERIPSYVFSHMKPGLEFLRLSYNRLHEDRIHAASFLGLQRSLTELLLDHNLLQSVPRGLLQLKALEVLKLNHNLIRKVPLNSVCDTHISEDSTLLSVHLENNFIDRRQIPPAAFSCIKNYQSVKLWPQKHEELE